MILTQGRVSLNPVRSGDWPFMQVHSYFRVVCFRRLVNTCILNREREHKAGRRGELTSEQSLTASDVQNFVHEFFWASHHPTRDSN